MKTIIAFANGSHLYPASANFDHVSQVTRRFFESAWLLLVCKLTIGAVSAYDIFLTIKYVKSLPNLELNPVGRWLMNLDTGPVCELDQVALFITVKFIGNFLTLAIIEMVGAWKQAHASLIAIVIATMQLGLLYYLIFGSNSPIPM